jgi:xanthosine utilization system XapX-like protein
MTVCGGALVGIAAGMTPVTDPAPAIIAIGGGLLLGAGLNHGFRRMFSEMRRNGDDGPSL